MSDLFDNQQHINERPLADRMRPQSLDDIIGQGHIVGRGRLLRRAIAADRLSSVIFYGPPGTGKTSLARVIANTTAAHFESLNAVLAGIKDIREAIENAGERRKLYGKRTILFVDEVHRWNKAQQDALLPWVENGTVILVGATTENPFFEVNRALVSRSRVFQLLPLSSDELRRAALAACADREKGFGKWRVVFEEGALEHLVAVASGDARSLLNALELAVETTVSAWPPLAGSEISVSVEAAEESIQRRAVLYDKDGDYHFDTISAFIKSVRGSDVDAALYWLARMVRAGEDPAFIFRRMIILASEDVGMADPHALQVVLSCAQSFERIGFPEGNYPLAHACIYLATAPKSNSAMAFFDALGTVEKEDAEIPNHLRDASRDKESFGHGEGYVYPHAYREHWTAQQYLPSTLQGAAFYVPSESGYEGKIREGVLQKREVQAAVLFSEANDKKRSDEDFLSWSPSSGKKGREQWFKRLESGRSKILLANRDFVFGEAAPSRHSRILILKGGDGLLLFEALRRAPEGLVACCLASETEKAALLAFQASSGLADIEKPVLQTTANGNAPSPEEAEQFFGCAEFDVIVCREPWPPLFKDCEPEKMMADFACAAKKLLAVNGKIILLQSPPALGERLSRILRVECAGDEALSKKLEEAENEFFAGRHGGAKPRCGYAVCHGRFWDEAMLAAAFGEAGLATTLQTIEQTEERLVFEKELSRWFGESSPWGDFMQKNIGDENCQKIKSLLLERAKRGPFIWKWKALLSTSKRMRNEE